MSKYHQKDSDIYYENTTIPKNKLQIKNFQEIHELEKNLIEDAYEIFISELNENTVFDEEYFINLHKRTFESIYEWAGKYRDFDMSKGGSIFCIGRALESESKKIFEMIKKENYFKNYDDVPKKEFAKKLAYIKCEIITLHPFFELNGRITRMFFDLIVIYNGYLPIDYSNYSSEEYIDASIECVQCADENRLEKIIFDGLVKAE